MSMTQVKAEMSEEKLEPLVIIEEGDTEGVAERRTVSRDAEVVLNNNGDSAVKKEDERSEEELSLDIVSSEMPSEAQSLSKQHPITEEKQRGLHADAGNEKDGGEQRPEETDNVDGENREGKESGETQDAMKCNKVPEKSTEHTDTVAEQDIATATGHQVDTNGLTSSDQLSMVSSESPVGARKQAHHRSNPEFPEALYELLCTLQEGRRINDQRCSFSLESGFARRRCHSEPNTRKPAKRVIFSSMTSLQREEFYTLVATAQARRLDDQRAELQRSPLPKSRASRFRGSIRQLTIVKKPAPVTVPKDDLYNMILTTQAQGRLEDQRSAAPGPVDDEDFFSLLLKVQGGRMEEQRTELPLKS